MSWPEVVLGALNVFQAVAIAYITLRQAEVKRELEAHNGAQAAAIRSLRLALEQQPPPSGP